MRTNMQRIVSIPLIASAVLLACRNLDPEPISKDCQAKNGSAVICDVATSKFQHDLSCVRKNGDIEFMTRESVPKFYGVQNDQRTVEGFSDSGGFFGRSRATKFSVYSMKPGTIVESIEIGVDQIDKDLFVITFANLNGNVGLSKASPCNDGAQK